VAAPAGPDELLLEVCATYIRPAGTALLLHPEVLEFMVSKLSWLGLPITLGMVPVDTELQPLSCSGKLSASVLYDPVGCAAVAAISMASTNPAAAADLAS
jgi:hypothetical protein